MKGNPHRGSAEDPDSPLRHTVCGTAQGWIAILGSEKGLLAVTLPHPSRESAIEELGGAVSDTEPDDSFFSDITSRLCSYFSGNPVNFDDKLDTASATSFQARVWQAAREIPYGQTRSYGWLAARAGKPGAARAAGQAMARNRLLVIVPCHRVIAADGSLGGFSGGLEVKKRLLDLESSSLKNQTA